jgi:hypothetical protein
VNSVLQEKDAMEALEEWQTSSPPSVAFSLKGDEVVFRQLWVTYQAVVV